MSVVGKVTSPQRGRGKRDLFFHSGTQVVSHPEPKPWGTGASEPATSSSPHARDPASQAVAAGLGWGEGHAEGERLREQGWAPQKPAEHPARQGVPREGAMQAGNAISHPPCGSVSTPGLFLPLATQVSLHLLTPRPS